MPVFALFAEWHPSVMPKHITFTGAFDGFLHSILVNPQRPDFFLPDQVHAIITQCPFGRLSEHGHC